jgi:molecular chaperone GrpE
LSNEETTPMPDGAAVEREVTPDAVDESSAVSVDQQVAAVQAKAQEYLDGWQRARADFVNYKKRMERELKDSREKSMLDTLAEIIPIIDDFERAMTNTPEDLSGQAWFDGITLIQRKLQKLLDDHNILVLDPVGQPFDPNRHEALGTDEDSDLPSGYVTTTLQKGYTSGERVLRPALVRVTG